MKRLIIIAAILFFASPIVYSIWWFKAGTMQKVEPKVEVLDTANWFPNHSRIVKGQ